MKTDTIESFEDYVARQPWSAPAKAKVLEHQAARKASNLNPLHPADIDLILQEERVKEGDYGHR